LPMIPGIVTIGVYGFSEEGFFGALRDAKVDTFCDIRRRRGLRGSVYAFANSARLQERLAEMGIEYFHCKELAPTEEIRERQKQEDKKLRIAKRTRTGLGDAFVQAYKQEVLSGFDARQFLEKLGHERKRGAASVVCFFCVEGAPEACHRSLLAERLEKELSIKVEHIRP
jgi:uncharacterized protein (DUF488 family)